MENTADLSIRVFGKDLSEIISNSLFATADVIYPVKKLTQNARSRMRYSFATKEEMLIKILTDVINEFELDSVLYFKCDSLEIMDKSASVVISGHKFKRAPSARNVIKSVTYHGLSLEEIKGHIDITYDL